MHWKICTRDDEAHQTCFPHVLLACSAAFYQWLWAGKVDNRLPFFPLIQLGHQKIRCPDSVLLGWCIGAPEVCVDLYMQIPWRPWFCYLVTTIKLCYPLLLHNHNVLIKLAGGYRETDRLVRENLPRDFMNRSINKICARSFFLLFWNGAGLRLRLFFLLFLFFLGRINVCPLYKFSIAVWVYFSKCRQTFSWLWPSTYVKGHFGSLSITYILTGWRKLCAIIATNLLSCRFGIINLPPALWGGYSIF